MNVNYSLSCADDHIVEILVSPGFCSAVGAISPPV